MSTNGTFVNGERLDAPYALRAGDKVELGACTLEFVPATPSAPTRTGSAGEGTLKIISGTGAGESTTVHGSATIGRDEGNDLRLQDPEVSRRHAKVTVQDGNAWIDDLSRRTARTSTASECWNARASSAAIGSRSA